MESLLRNQKASAELRAAIVSVFQVHHAKLVEMAETVTRDVPSMKGLFSGADLDQLVTGFETLVAEALEGESRSVWDLFIGSVGEGFAASSQPVEAVAGAVASWAVSLTLALSNELPDHLRAEADRWFTAFFGAYTCAMIEAVVAPARGRASA